MKARIVRFLFALHRWMGVTLGLLMLVWCVSGVVMIWWPQPSMRMDGRDYRLEGLAPIALPAEVKLPDIPADAPLTTARVEMLVDRPVATLAWGGEQGGRGRYDLTTGEEITEIGEAEALAVARTYAREHKLNAEPKLSRVMDRDEFTVSGEFNAARPLYEIALNDPEGTVLYVSSRSGAVAQRTTSALRFWSWAGWIPHWLYFTELRRNAPLWNQIIVWTSLAGCFLTVLGLFVGIRQFRIRHSTAKRDSPYRGAKFWHHMAGLVFGVLVLTFTFSGFASMNPWGWLEGNQATGEAVGRYTGEPSPWSETRPALEAQLASLRAQPAAIKLVALTTQQDRPWFMWTSSDGAVARVGADGRPAPFQQSGWAAAAARFGGDGAATPELMSAGDTYYYPSDPKSYPVVRINTPATDTNFYLDADTGEVVYASDPGSRGFRWWHSALHTFDVMGSPLREIVIFLAMLGVTTVCGLGAWLGLKKLARGGKLDNLPPDEPTEPPRTA